MNNENYKVRGHVVITDEKSNVLLDKDNMILKAGRKEIMRNGITAFTSGKAVLGYDSQNTIVASGDEYNTYFSSDKKITELGFSGKRQILKLKGADLVNPITILNTKYKFGYETDDTTICLYKADATGYTQLANYSSFGYPITPDESNNHFRYISGDELTGFSKATEDSDITMYFTIPDTAIDVIKVFTILDGKDDGDGNIDSTVGYTTYDTGNLTLEYYIPYSVSGSSNVKLNTLGIATSENAPALLTRVSFTSVELTKGSTYNIKYTLYF